MKKQIFAWITVFLLIVPLFLFASSHMVFANEEENFFDFAGGCGTEENPYENPYIEDVHSA